MNLFVYGTLCRGMSNDHFLKKATLIASKAWTQGRLYDTRNGFPGLIHGKGKVYGEIYYMNRMQLKRVDHLEDYIGPKSSHNLFERRINRISIETGWINAYLYYYCDEERLKRTGIWIPQGDWCRYTGNK